MDIIKKILFISRTKYANWIVGRLHVYDLFSISFLLTIYYNLISSICRGVNTNMHF